MCGMCVSQKIPGTGVGRLCRAVIGCWKLTLSPLEGQSVLLIAESSLLSPMVHFVSHQFRLSCSAVKLWHPISVVVTYIVKK